MSRKNENTHFCCENCGAVVLPVTNGSYRNHCPFCLFSKHLDVIPGDRKSNCKGLMKPIEIDYSSKKGYQLIHQCETCNKTQRNKIAINTVQEDKIINYFQVFH